MSTSPIRLVRRIRFSSGHRYWDVAKSEAENRAKYGRWASPFNHGHNYVLDVGVEGMLDPRTGMVVNIKRVDDVLKDHIVAQFDQKSINDEVEAFKSKSVTLENLLTYFGAILTQPGVLPPQVQLATLRLEETHDLYGEWSLSTNTMTLTRSYEFAAAHRLHVPQLSEEENVRLFGKCNHISGHGHNYILEVSVSGEVDPLTGMMVDLMELDRIVNEEIVDRYDHKFLNIDIPEFKESPTTSECIAQEVFNRLDRALPVRLSRVRLFETARSYFEVESAS
ncbi:MAG: 6-carboxytetrahydropterin synthase [Armatimonadetes bacterium]|nr:6-carboxytetrahydropterin synthase [Armatimonadota bacterium]